MELYALLEESSDIIVLPEVEPVFRATSLYGALCKMYSKSGDDAALLEVWKKCVGSSHASTCVRFCLQLKSQTC